MQILYEWREFEKNADMRKCISIISSYLLIVIPRLCSNSDVIVLQISLHVGAVPRQFRRTANTYTGARQEAVHVAWAI